MKRYEIRRTDDMVQWKTKTAACRLARKFRIVQNACYEVFDQWQTGSRRQHPTSYIRRDDVDVVGDGCSRISA